ncbi:hypothetical protein [Flavonifractor sp. An100]|uniref:hypothetical protein n=1 Tax=Flavonifractor sp. An100 TaxID=1965538 RepID=UPI000B3871E2|nr:hypothetical protein [Flavonifractor sp. An100]OUQ76386.1 hypothetical protein B5E43_11725 [Flavonifractor sp. An100]
MKVGQKVVRYPETFWEREGDRNSPKRPLSGKVVYIHPKGRYHTVEFDLPGGKVRENFPGVEE